MTKIKYNTEEKYKIVQKYLEKMHKDEYCSLRTTASIYGINHQTLKNWIDVYQEKGLDGLIDQRFLKNQLLLLEGENKEFYKIKKENKKLKRENNELRLENEIIQKFDTFLKNEVSKKE